MFGRAFAELNGEAGIYKNTLIQLITSIFRVSMVVLFVAGSLGLMYQGEMVLGILCIAGLYVYLRKTAR